MSNYMEFIFEESFFEYFYLPEDYILIVSAYQGNPQCIIDVYRNLSLDEALSASVKKELETENFVKEIINREKNIDK